MSRASCPPGSQPAYHLRSIKASPIGAISSAFFCILFCLPLRFSIAPDSYTEMFDLMGNSSSRLGYLILASERHLLVRVLNSHVASILRYLTMRSHGCYVPLSGRHQSLRPLISRAVS